MLRYFQCNFVTLQPMKTGKMIRMLIAFTRDGKVIDLVEYTGLRDVLLESASHIRRHGCKTEVYIMSSEFVLLEDRDKRVPRAPHPNGKRDNKVRCVETGEIFGSVAECSQATGLPVQNIYKSIIRQGTTNGRHFEYVICRKEDVVCSM